LSQGSALKFYSWSHQNLRVDYNYYAPLILKMRDIIFFLRANYIMGHFKGYFEGAKTFLTPKLSQGAARGNFVVQKVEAPSKYPEKWPIM
jgi:hypothetical protein